MVFAEYPREPIGHIEGTAKWTTQWMSTCFGENAVKVLYGRPIICSGTIMGNKIGVCVYMYVWQIDVKRERVR